MGQWAVAGVRTKSKYRWSREEARTLMIDNLSFSSVSAQLVSDVTEGNRGTEGTTRYGLPGAGKTWGTRPEGELGFWVQVIVVG